MRTIKTRCYCGRLIEVPESWAGKAGRCKACGMVLRVPAVAAKVVWKPQPAPPPQPPVAKLVRPAEPAKPGPTAEESVPLAEIVSRPSPVPVREVKEITHRRQPEQADPPSPAPAAGCSVGPAIVQAVPAQQAADPARALMTKKKSFLYSLKIYDRDSCVTAIRTGGIAAMISAAITSVFGFAGFFTSSSDKYVNYFLNPWILFVDVPFIVVLGIFVFRKSRIASTLLVIYFVGAKLIMWVDLGTPKGSGLLMTILFFLCYVTAMRGTYIWHSRYRDIATKTKPTRVSSTPGQGPTPASQGKPKRRNPQVLVASVGICAITALLITFVIATALKERGRIRQHADEAQERRSVENPPFEPDELADKFGHAVALIKVCDIDGKEAGIGSGFVVDPSGIIVTNYHVIEGAYSAVAKLAAGGLYPVGGVLGYDRIRDVAVLKVDAKDLPCVKLGTFRGLKVGSKVVAIGNPAGFESTVSNGIVSALRTAPDESVSFIQTTASVSPGSSGGPLFSDRGEVVGIITLASGGQVQNLNFAVPIDYAKPYLDSSSLTELSVLNKDSVHASVKSLCEEALAAYQNGKYDEAIATLRTALDADPNFAEGWLYLGCCYFQKKLYQAAIDCYKKVIQLRPDDVEGYFCLGRAYRCLGNDDVALQQFREAVRVAPQFASAHTEISVILLARKDFFGAMRESESAIKCDSNNAMAHSVLGTSLIAVGLHQEQEQGIQELRLACQIEPASVGCRHALACGYFALRMYDEFQREREIVRKLDPELVKDLDGLTPW